MTQFPVLYSISNLHIILQLKYKEVYERNKAHINIAPDAHEIRAAKEAYKNISNVSLHWSPTKNGEFGPLDDL